MLTLKNVSKSYTAENFTQTALDNVSINFKNSDFVAILGPSGSGKTTLLNVIGGLDKYDSGNLIIDSIQTSLYKDHDWDAYRNNRVGFIFQSYNLIPHQNILSNVELALKLSGVGRAERKSRAIRALREVGLEKHVYKHPNQLSGGQMQRVAIARALVNNPEIILADEPTGALDSNTSIQIMRLLSRIAQNRLVIMVTHNPELAAEYATRIITLRDGRIETDSSPQSLDKTANVVARKKNKKTSMPFLTAVALSFMNLMTKKGRTLVVSFAGSIGIIGIATVLALSSGINNFIGAVQEDTLLIYPMSIESRGVNISSLIASTANTDDQKKKLDSKKIPEKQILAQQLKSIESNDLRFLKQYFESNSKEIDQYASAVQYNYGITPQIFLDTPENSAPRRVNPNTSLTPLGIGGGGSVFSQIFDISPFHLLPDTPDLIESRFDIIAGKWPRSEEDLLVVLSNDGSISDLMLYSMGLGDSTEIDAMIKKIVNNEPFSISDKKMSFSDDEIMNASFKLVNSSQLYERDPAHGIWSDKSNDSNYLKSRVSRGKKLHVSGIVRPKKTGTKLAALSEGIYYTSDLTKSLVNDSAKTDVVKEQLANPSRNIFTGQSFADSAKNKKKHFDLNSLINVDKDAIVKAFKVDESALHIDSSALRISMPDFNFNTSDLPALDLKTLLSESDMKDLMRGIDIGQIIEKINFDQLDKDGVLNRDVGRIRQSIMRMIQGYMAYCAVGGSCDNPVQSFDTFTKTPTGAQVESEIRSELSMNQNTGRSFISDFDGILSHQFIDAIEAEVGEIIQHNFNMFSQRINASITGYVEKVIQTLGEQISEQIKPALERQIEKSITLGSKEITQNLSKAMGVDEDAFKKAISFNMKEEDIAQVLASAMLQQNNSLKENMRKLNYADFSDPSTINIYPKNFKAKEKIIDIINSYNSKMRSEGNDARAVTYNDFVGTLMASITKIINIVSYGLICFVGISLLVSSIMIGVITYISVFERKKEIGILRSIGASKRDIRRVFNAETLIIGFVAGAIGILITLLLSIPVNLIVNSKFAIASIARLPFQAALILVAISMLLTFLAGLIPSSAAARRDPVEALRSV